MTQLVDGRGRVSHCRRGAYRYAREEGRVSTRWRVPGGDIIMSSRSAWHRHRRLCVETFADVCTDTVQSTRRHPPALSAKRAQQQPMAQNIPRTQILVSNTVHPSEEQGSLEKCLILWCEDLELSHGPPNQGRELKKEMTIIGMWKALRSQNWNNWGKKRNIIWS